MSYSKGVLGSLLFLPAKEIEDIEGLRSELTVTPKFGEGESIELFRETSAWFGVPLFHYPNLTGIKELDDRRITSKIEFLFRGKLRPEQKNLMDKIYDAVVHSGKSNFIIKAKPGFGKTVLAIGILGMLRQRTLVVVPRSNLIRQWKDRLLKFSDLKSSDIGWVEGGRGEWRGKKVVIGLVHSLVLNRYGDLFRRNFGLVVFDEVDRSVPPQTFAPAISMIPAKYRIGMSATTKRSDGMEVIFEKHLGEVYLEGADEGRMKPRVLIHHFVPSSGYVHAGSNRLNRRGMLLSRLANNQVRNRIVANYTYMIWKSGRQCLVLSDRKKQLVSIYWELAKHFKIPEKEIGYYVRSLGKKQFSHSQRERTASACTILLATYGMIQIGTDIKSLAGLVYATPQSDTEQSSGRIEREMEGKKQPVVVDIVDLAYTDCIRWAVKRKRFYHSQGLEVKTLT